MTPDPRGDAILWFERLLDEYLDLPPEDDYSQMAMQEGEKRAKSAVKATDRKAFAAKFHKMVLHIQRSSYRNMQHEIVRNWNTAPTPKSDKGFPVPA